MLILFENDPPYRYEGLALAALSQQKRGGIADADFYREQLLRPTLKGKIALKEVLAALTKKCDTTRLRHLIPTLEGFKDKISSSTTGEDINKIVNDLISIVEENKL